MAHSITVRLNQAASVFAAGKSTGFGLRGGVKYYDRDAEKELYTNYEAVVFASNPNQIAYYQQVLVEGAIIEISARNQRIKQFQGQNGLNLSIELLDCQLGLIAQGMPKDQSQGASQPQGGYQQGAAPQQGGNQRSAPQRQPQAQQGGYQQQARHQPRYSAPQQQGGYQQDGGYPHNEFENQ